MSDRTDANIEREEQNAMNATAVENLEEFRKESKEMDDNDSGDEVVKPTVKPSLDASTKDSNDNVKKEAPEMNIQLQR
jgi:hypothetical protein